MKTCSSDGFSLIEMLVALLILALATTALSVGFSKRQQAATAAELARVLAIEAAALGSQSVAAGETRRITVDVKSRNIGIGMVNLAVPPELTVTIKTGAELISQESRGSILFFSDGTSTGGEVTLSEPSGTTAVVSINWVTGAVQIDRPRP